MFLYICCKRVSVNFIERLPVVTKLQRTKNTPNYWLEKWNRVYELQRVYHGKMCCHACSFEFRLHYPCNIRNDQIWLQCIVKYREFLLTCKRNFYKHSTLCVECKILIQHRICSLGIGFFLPDPKLIIISSISDKFLHIKFARCPEITRHFKDIQCTSDRLAA